MPSPLHMVLISPRNERADEWLVRRTAEHEREIQALDGVKRVHSFKLAGVQPRGEPPWRLLMLYELDDAAPTELVDAIHDRLGTAFAEAGGEDIGVSWTPVAP